MIKSKKGFELSLNTIVIVIIALVFLGIAIGIVVNWGNLIKEQIPKIFPKSEALWPPTSENPVYVKPPKLELARSNSEVLNLQVYNFAAKDVNCTVKVSPQDPINENAAEIKYGSTNRAIPVDNIGEWLIHLKVNKNTPSTTYMYTINTNCGEFSKEIDFVLTVK